MDNPDLIIKLISGSSGISAAIWTGVFTLVIGFSGVIATVRVAIYNAKASSEMKKAEFESSHQLKEMEFKEMKRVNQTQVYWEWLASLQDLMNASANPDAFTRFQKNSMKVIVQGEDELAGCMRDYYFEITEYCIKANNDPHTPPLDHKPHQRKIINLMRIAQGMKNVGDIYLIGFTPEENKTDS